MKDQQKQYAGVWLDNSSAVIISKTSGNDNSEYAIQDKIKAQENQSGGSEHTMNNAKQTGNIKYYKSVSALLLPYDEILIFGPGKAQEQFKNYLHEDTQFKNKKITVDSGEHLTDPQMLAKVRDFFK